MSETIRLLLAFGAFIGAVVTSAVMMAIAFAVLRLWLEGDGKASWLFRELDTYLGPSSPADMLLVIGSVGVALTVALLVWQVRGKQ